MKMRNTKLIINRMSPMMVALAISGAAYAEDPVDSGVAPVCGALVTFVGNLQVFDASRSVIRDVTNGMQIHCGDWVAVEEGKATIRQIQSGGEVILSAGAFAQIVNSGSTSGSIREHIVLYRGELYAKQNSREEFRIVTPQGRVTFAASEGYVLAQDAHGETQALAVNGKIRLENRFIDHPPTFVGEGKYSKVGGNATRNIPLDPRYGEPNMMQERLTKFGVAPSKIAALVTAARKSARPSLPAKLGSGRADRKLASVSRGKGDAEFKADQAGGGGESKESVVPGPKPKRLPSRLKHAARAPSSVFDTASKPKRSEEDQKEKELILKRLSIMTDEDSG